MTRPPAWEVFDPAAIPPEVPPVDVGGYQPPPAALGGLCDDEATVRIRRAIAAAPLDHTIVHNTPRGGKFAHPPGVPCDECDALLDTDP